MQTPFENIQIDVDSLPKQADVQFKNLQRSYLMVSMISLGIFWILASLLAFLGPEIFELDIPKDLLTYIYIGLIVIAIISFYLRI